jgi:hypothetical protein
MHRHLCLFALIVLVALTASASAQEPPQRPEVERFVRAFGAMEMFQARAAAYLKVAKAPTSPDAEKTRIFMERVVAAKPVDLLPAFVEAFSTALSPSEATEMAEALETPIGRKIIRISIEAYRVYGGDIIAARDANPLSSEERNQLNELGATPGWKTYRRISEDATTTRRIPGAILGLPLFSDLR